MGMPKCINHLCVGNQAVNVKDKNGCTVNANSILRNIYGKNKIKSARYMKIFLLNNRNTPISKTIILLCALIALSEFSYAQKTNGAGTHSLRGSGLNFTQNKGQIVDVKNQLRPDILFRGEAKGTDVYIRKTGISYVQSNEDKVLYEVH